MMKIFVKLILAASAFASFSLSAYAVEVREAIKICDNNPQCEYKVSDTGVTTFVVDDGSGGTNIVQCPQRGECQCLTCKPGTKKTSLGKTLMGKLPKNAVAN
jgi:hypothetical protein